MKIAFFSNFLNDHQLPICNAFVDKKIDFTFVAFEPIDKERIALSFEDMNQKPFVLRVYEGEEQQKKHWIYA